MGTTIFTVMSALAAEKKAVNLGQGFPDFPCDPRLPALVNDAMSEGLNQYPPMTGVAPLREAVSRKIQSLYGRHYDPVSEITVTAGATQAILTILLAIVHPPGTFRPDFDKIRAAITPKTRAILINSPHNPSGMIWSQQDMLTLQEILAPTNIVLISDEVYEHMVYAPHQHWSAAHFEALAARAFIVSSFGKTYHVTGWKVGTVAAPAAYTAEFRKVHQFNVFTVNTPMQHALARFMADPAPYLELPAFYQRKRDLFRAGLAKTHFKLLPGEGTYFQCVDISSLKVPEKNLSEADFCKWLTTDIGVAAIPLSAFYGDGFDQKVIRFCFAKQDHTLLAALDKLKGL
jgi:methionine aminotransferase